MKRIWVSLIVACVCGLVLATVGESANTGAYSTAGTTMDSLGALLWKVVKLALLGFTGYALFNTFFRNWVYGLMELGGAVILGIMVFVVIPPIFNAGDAAGATLDDPQAVVWVDSATERWE